MRFVELFAGVGMTRIGLGPQWTCTLALDVDSTKTVNYRANHGDAHLFCADIADLKSAAIAGAVDLLHASRPCQDFSLAGLRRGMAGRRSGMLAHVFRILDELDEEGRLPTVVNIENVEDIITSKKGADFADICRALTERGYSIGAMIIDAAHFVPQSRSRMFLVASQVAPDELTAQAPSDPFHPRLLRDAYVTLPDEVRAKWRWWSISTPASRNTKLIDLIEPDDAIAWRSDSKTQKILSEMSDINRAKVYAAKKAGSRQALPYYRRTRQGVAVYEVRNDGLSGCLRTARGGSSVQQLLVIDGDLVRSRPMIARESARVMGLPDSFILPKTFTAAYSAMGDGLVPQVMAHLSEQLFMPLINAKKGA